MSDHIQENNELDINLLDLLIELGQEKWTLIVVTFLAALTGVVVSLNTPFTYVSRTSIITSQQSGGGLGVGVGVGALAGLSGLAGLPGITSSVKSSDEMLIALMRSYSVQLSLIEQLKLKERYGSRNIDEARQVLSNNVAIVVDKKSGILYVDAQDKDPEFAAHLANAQVKELVVILSKLALTESQKRRSYFEDQIVKTQNKIPQIEMEFKEAQKKSGLEVASLLSEAGTLPGQIAAKELSLQVLSRFATSQNPELKRLSVEISALRAQMARYELSKSKSKISELSELGQIAENTKANFVQKATQAYNTLKIQEALLDSYVKQLELAKVDESREGQLVQVIDEAKAPLMRLKPERKKIVLQYTVTGLIIALVLAFLRALMRRNHKTQDGLRRWGELKRAWGFK